MYDLNTYLKLAVINFKFIISEHFSKLGFHPTTKFMRLSFGKVGHGIFQIRKVHHKLNKDQNQSQSSSAQGHDPSSID